MRLMMKAASLPRPLRITRGALADLVGGADDADGALGGREGFVAGEEAEALGLVAQQHGAEIAVAEADLALLGDGAGHAEGLQADADILGGVGAFLTPFFIAMAVPTRVGPDGVVERDRLHAADDLLDVYALFKADVAAFLQRTDAVLLEAVSILSILLS
jgi:hypothetical protein